MPCNDAALVLGLGKIRYGRLGSLPIVVGLEYDSPLDLASLMEKVSKAAVNYREAEGKQRCGNCAMWHRSNESCDLVLGRIRESDTCDEWLEKSRSESPR